VIDVDPAHPKLLTQEILIDTIFTVDTRPGQWLRDRDRGRASPLVRVSPEVIARAGIERVPRVEGVVAGKPQLEDARVFDVASVVWATGFRPAFDWIDLPIWDDNGVPLHHRGVVDRAPGQAGGCGTSAACAVDLV
jgi:putative flavoprotein involved in K+ transport